MPGILPDPYGGPVLAQPLVRPPPVHRGSRVAVVAPSGVVDAGRLERGLAFLHGLGLEVQLGRHVLNRGGQGLPFLAGDDADRAGDLQEAWCDPRVRAVLVARGGTGAARLVEQLDWGALAAAGPTLLVGSSDTTALHLAVAARLGLGTLWGPVAAGELLAGEDGPEPRSAAHLAGAMTRPDLDVRLGVRADADVAGALGPAAPVRGPLVGGTLSLLCAAAGTPDALRAEGGVLVLEDVAEDPYRLDRMLTHLHRAGTLAGVAGVACGDWIACGDPAAVRAVLADRLGRLGVPVLLGLPFGHGRIQLSLPLGATAVLDASVGSLVVPGS
jgi:muramoyltetrapeptide carboxypeptidase